MSMQRLTQMEMVEVCDAISEVMGRIIFVGDPERSEARHGTLTLLSRAQAKLMPVALGFTVEEATWWPEQNARIAAIRQSQGQPADCADVEKTDWHVGVIYDAICEVLTRLVVSGDPDKHESKYGTLTLLHRAQAKMLPDLVDRIVTRPAPALWKEYQDEIGRIRRKQNLPPEPSAAEMARWQSGVTPRF